MRYFNGTKWVKGSKAEKRLNEVNETLVFDGRIVRDKNDWDVIIGRRPMTPDELAFHLWWTETPMDEDQREENRVWINELFSTIEVGRGWLWPIPTINPKNNNSKIMPRYFKKITEHHLQERDISQSVLKAMDGKWFKFDAAIKRGDWKTVDKILVKAGLPTRTVKSVDKILKFIDIEFDTYQSYIEEE